jgi:hypothetical protein
LLGGLKIAMAEAHQNQRFHTCWRVAFLDYLSTFPRIQIVLTPRKTGRCIFERFAPVLKLSSTS